MVDRVGESAAAQGKRRYMASTRSGIVTIANCIVVNPLRQAQDIHIGDEAKQAARRNVSLLSKYLGSNGLQGPWLSAAPQTVELGSNAGRHGWQVVVCAAVHGAEREREVADVP